MDDPQAFYRQVITDHGEDTYDFQAEGVAWLAERRTAYLADEMGMGKSMEAGVAADFLEIPHIQVICPAIAVTDWLRKFERWSIYPRALYTSYNSAPVPPAAVRKNSVIISGFETSINHRKLLQANPHGGLLILDECHGFKNPAAKRTRGMYGEGCAGGLDKKGCECIIKHYERVWLLSGTPVPNGDPRELWPHLRALRPWSVLNSQGAPMSYREWENEFCIFAPGLGEGKVVGIRDPARLQRILSDFMLRRLGNVAGLPSVRFELYPMKSTHFCADVAAASWPELTDAFNRILKSAETADLDTQLMEQMATVRRLTGLLKVDATVELAAGELRTGQLDKVVIFGYHVDVVEGIAHGLCKFGAAAITGATPNSERWRAIDAFNSGKHRVLASNILAGGTNLSVPCRHVLFAETDWVANNNLQAAYRTRRIDGHRDPILARMIAIEGTIDDLMQQVARRKLRHTQLILPT